MNATRRFLSMMVLSFLIIANLSFLGVSIVLVRAEAMGTLSGTIYDMGVDSDSDGAFEVLQVGVELNVSAAGSVYVEVAGLYDAAHQYVGVWSSAFTNVSLGAQVVFVDLDGSAIYASGRNPVSVVDIYLFDEYHSPLDDVHDVPLSQEYDFTWFGLSPAVLTHEFTDLGVDSDSDGTFDVLEVHVGVNVTVLGTYRISVSGLKDSMYNYISVSDVNSASLDIGLHELSLSLSGPTICTSKLNPSMIATISLRDEYYNSLDTAYDVPLSRTYAYTEFDSPFRDMAVTFVVYPDGRVITDGVLNYTNMEPPNTGPAVEGVATVQTSGNVTDVAATFTLTIPADEASQSPFNASTINLLADYADDLLTTTIKGTTVLPSDAASQLPFNITDLVVVGEYDGDVVTGNITMDTMSGFPLDDLVVNFQGNHTYVHLNGSTYVVFANYPSIGEVNASVLEQLLAELTNTLGGQGPNSLYNSTYGLLELTMLQNVTTLYGGYATVDFEAVLTGDLIETWVLVTMQPPYVSDVLHAAWASVGSGSLVLTYTHTLKQADFSVHFVANATQLIDLMVPILPDILPSDAAAAVESIFTTPYCTVDSAHVSVAYENAQANITATASIHGFNAELNYLKYLWLDLTMPSPWPPVAFMLNDLQLNLTDLTARVNLTDTALLLDVNGVAVDVPFHWINATNFTLEHFFNVTAGDQEPPRANEQLTVMVVGGSNATHTVTVVCPDTVPEPDVSLPSAATWYNQSISQLTGLMFQLGPRDTTPPTIDPCVQTPLTPDFDEAVTVAANVTDTDTGVRPDGVILSYRTNGGTWTNVTMSHTTGDTYEGVIPALPGGTHVEYMIIAYDYADNPAVDDAAGLYYVYTVIPEFPAWSILAVAALLGGLVLVAMKRRRAEKA